MKSHTDLNTVLLKIFALLYFTDLHIFVLKLTHFADLAISLTIFN